MASDDVMHGCRPVLALKGDDRLHRVGAADRVSARLGRAFGSAAHAALPAIGNEFEVEPEASVPKVDLHFGTDAFLLDQSIVECGKPDPFFRAML